MIQQKKANDVIDIHIFFRSAMNDLLYIISSNVEFDISKRLMLTKDSTCRF